MCLALTYCGRVVEYGGYLAEIALNEEYYLPARQMSVLLLKSHIENHWTSSAADSALPECWFSEAEEQQLRKDLKRLLLDGMLQDNRMIRNSFAYCLAFVISKDWPDDWPDCFDLLDGFLSEREDCSMLGIVTVYQELLHLMSPDKLQAIVSILIDQLCRILFGEQVCMLSFVYFMVAIRSCESL